MQPRGTFFRSDARHHPVSINTPIRLCARTLRHKECYTRVAKSEAATGTVDVAVCSNFVIDSSSHAPASLQSAKFVQQPQLHPLIEWVNENNGYVHPALAIVDNAPCGCRGVVATADIHLPSQRQQRHHTGGHHHHQQRQHIDSFQKFHHTSPTVPAVETLGFTAGLHQLLLIAVPEQLYMTADDALHILTPAILNHQDSQPQHQNTAAAGTKGASGQAQWGLAHIINRLNPIQAQQQQQRKKLAESLSKLQPPLLLALLLAYERSKGEASFWHPYISSLPQEPPCGWVAALQQQQQQQQDLAGAVQSAAAAVLAKCSAAANMYGPALSGCFTADDVVWAYGQVVSRAFGSGSDIGLAPLIDMCNHKQGSGTPQLLAKAPITNDARHTYASQTATHSGSMTEEQQHFWCVCKAAVEDGVQTEQGGQLVLREGEELYISYVASCDATTAYLNFGFVPPERA